MNISAYDTVMVTRAEANRACYYQANLAFPQELLDLI